MAQRSQHTLRAQSQHVAACVCWFVSTFYQWLRLRGCTFSDNAGKVTPDGFSEAADYTFQSQETNSGSIFIREFWMLKFCHQLFFTSLHCRRCDSELTVFDFMSVCRFFAGKRWDWDLLAERKAGQGRERSGGVSTVRNSDHQQGHQQGYHLGPWAYGKWRGTGKTFSKDMPDCNMQPLGFFFCLIIIFDSLSSFLFLCPQVFPLVAGEDEDDVKSIRSHRIKMAISGHSLEESMEECRVEEMSVHKVRGNISFLWLWKRMYFVCFSTTDPCCLWWTVLPAISL